MGMFGCQPLASLICRGCGLLCVFLGSSWPSSAAAQSVTFTNSTPPVAIRLQAGSEVAMDAASNFVMVCDAIAPDGCQRLTLPPGGGGGSCTSQCGSGAAFTTPLAVVNPSNPPAPGPYPPGSTLTVRAEVTGAVVCMPDARLGTATINLLGWTAPLVPSNAIVVQSSNLPSNIFGATITLRLSCFGSTGSAVTERTVQTTL